MYKVNDQFSHDRMIRKITALYEDGSYMVKRGHRSESGKIRWDQVNGKDVLVKVTGDELESFIVKGKESKEWAEKMDKATDGSPLTGPPIVDLLVDRNTSLAAANTTIAKMKLEQDRLEKALSAAQNRVPPKNETAVLKEENARLQKVVDDCTCDHAKPAKRLTDEKRVALEQDMVNEDIYTRLAILESFNRPTNLSTADRKPVIRTLKHALLFDATESELNRHTCLGWAVENVQFVYNIGADEIFAYAYMTRWEDEPAPPPDEAEGKAEPIPEVIYGEPVPLPEVAVKEVVETEAIPLGSELGDDNKLFD